MASKDDIAYLAGLLDGDGMITLRKQKSGDPKYNLVSYTAAIQVRMTCEKTTSWLKNTFGGNLYFEEKKPKGWKPTYLWHYNGRKAVALIKEIIPHLICKKEAALVVLEYYSTVGKRGDPKLSKEVKQRRTNLIDKIRSINKRGTN